MFWERPAMCWSFLSVKMYSMKVQGKIISCLLGLACSFSVFGQSSRQLIDDNATPETKALYQNLFKIAEQGFMFGHEDTDAYGIGWWAKKGKSDVKEVTGSYPAVHGWDLGNIDRKFNIDTVNFKKMRNWIKATYKRGGINTISWHIPNLLSGGDSWDTTPTVPTILPGGSKHQAFLERLNLVADFLESCKVGSTYIPIIFRPWHEHNGGWFWWGKGNVSEEDYIALWRFTVDFLKNERGIHHLIYAFSPDRSRMDLDDAQQSYLYAYPGDDYVDVLGLDNYWDVGHAHNTADGETQKQQFVKSLQVLTTIAREKGKVSALTETGSMGIKNPKWFTEVILNPLKENQKTIDIAWMLVWRNRFAEEAMAAYPGHPAAEDFKTFQKDPLTIFEDDLKNIYNVNSPILK